MKAGQLRHRVTIERLDVGQDSAGAIVESWSEFAVVWAAVEPIGGREYWQAQQVAAENSVRVRIRYVEGVVPTMRIVYGSRKLNILAVVDIEERHRELQLMCSEIHEAAA